MKAVDQAYEKLDEMFGTISEDTVDEVYGVLNDLYVQAAKEGAQQQKLNDKGASCGCL